MKYDNWLGQHFHIHLWILVFYRHSLYYGLELRFSCILIPAYIYSTPVLRTASYMYELHSYLP